MARRLFISVFEIKFYLFSYNYQSVWFSSAKTTRRGILLKYYMFLRKKSSNSQRFNNLYFSLIHQIVKTNATSVAVSPSKFCKTHFLEDFLQLLFVLFVLSLRRRHRMIKLFQEFIGKRIYSNVQNKRNLF